MLKKAHGQNNLLSLLALRIRENSLLFVPTQSGGMEIIMDFIFPVAIIGGMGLIFGALLAIASKKFAVKVDERVPMIIDVLPGANCGGCGYAGCAAYAEAIVKGEAKSNCCPSGGSAVAAKIAGIMGTDALEVVPKVARVMCSGTNECAKSKYIYDGETDCYSALKLGGGQKSCVYGCLGLGSCVKACDRDAISIVNGVAVVDRDKCGACGQCVSACPKNLIELCNADISYMVSCNSKDKGKKVKTVCDVGCIGCGICAKVCLAEAITIVDNLAIINPEKCANCGMCAEKCPQKIIKFESVQELEDVDEFVRV